MSLAKIEVTAGDGHVETRDLPLLDLGAYLKGDESEKAAQAKELQFASETVSFLALKTMVFLNRRSTKPLPRTNDFLHCRLKKSSKFRSTSTNEVTFDQEQPLSTTQATTKTLNSI